MLASAVLTLVACEDTTLPASLGRSAHALLLGLIHELDPGLAAELHDDHGVKPFTTAFLEEGAASARRATPCRTGERYHVRFAALGGRLSTLLLDDVPRRLPERVRVEDAEFQVEGMTADPAAHPWAGRTSYQELAQRHLLSRSDPGDRVALAFLSPTTFRSQGHHVPLPLPNLVFGSLLDRWNAFAPVRLDEIRSYAAESIAVARYRLQTQLVAVGGGKQVGFVGQCEYVAMKPDPYALRQLHLLAEYAFYSGVGHKTTMGLGRARRLRDARALSG